MKKCEDCGEACRLFKKVCLCQNCYTRLKVIEAEHKEMKRLLANPKRNYIKIGEENVIKSEHDIMLDYMESRIEYSEVYRRDEELKKMLLGHLLWVYATKKRVPDKYMELGERWGSDAEFWVEKLGKLGKQKRICFKVGETSRPAFIMWMARVKAARFNFSGIRKLVRGLRASMPKYKGRKDDLK